jgi:hypothetical protein
MRLNQLAGHIRGGRLAVGISHDVVREQLAELGLESVILENLYESHNGFEPDELYVDPDIFGMVFDPLEKSVELYQMLRSIDTDTSQMFESDGDGLGWFGSQDWFPIFRFPDSGIVLLG